jgi:hypothetical protein
MSIVYIFLTLLVGGLLIFPQWRNRRRTPFAPPSPAATVTGGAAGGAAPAPGAAASTTTTATTSPTSASKWSGGAKNGAMLAVGGLVLWLIIIGPADWMGDMARFNWTTSTALGAWLAGTVGANLANLLMWGLVGGAILLTVLVWTGKHKGLAKTISSIPLVTLATLGVVGFVGFHAVTGIISWLNAPTVTIQRVTFSGLTTANVVG